MKTDEVIESMNGQVSVSPDPAQDPNKVHVDQVPSYRITVVLPPYLPGHKNRVVSIHAPDSQHIGVAPGVQQIQFDLKSFDGLWVHVYTYDTVGETEENPLTCHQAIRTAVASFQLMCFKPYPFQVQPIL